MRVCVALERVYGVYLECIINHFHSQFVNDNGPKIISDFLILIKTQYCFSTTRSTCWITWQCISYLLTHRECFAAVDKAYKLLLDPEQKKRAVDVIHAGREYIEHNVRALSVGY